MYKVSEVAEKLNVSDSIVYGLIETGKLVSHRIGLGRGCIRISEYDLQVYLASCRSTKESVPQPKPRRLRLKHLA